MKYKINQLYMSHYGVTRYRGIEDQKHNFEFKNLVWQIPLDSEQHFIESSLDKITNYMSEKELHKYLKIGD